LSGTHTHDEKIFSHIQRKQACSGKVFRLARNFLPQASFKKASKIMLVTVVTPHNSREVADLLTDDGPVRRRRCTAPKIINSVVDMLVPHAKVLVPGFTNAKPVGQVYWMVGEDDNENVAHLDGPALTGMVAVYPVGAAGTLM
jgi:hypothetical protein